MSAPAGDALRAELRAERGRVARRLAGLGVAGALLLTVYSGGFFLYAALVLAAMTALSWGMAVAGAEAAVVRRAVDRERLEQGETARVRVTLRNDSPWPLPWLFWEDRIDGGLQPEGVSCAMLGLRPGGEEVFDYSLPARRRGLYRVGPALIEVSGPFGLVRRLRLGREATFLTVLPRAVPLGRPLSPADRPVREIPRRRSLFEDPSRFAGIRRFQAGDGLRRVHWRATARTGQLQSRVYEPAVLGGILLAVELHAGAWGAPDEDGGNALVELAITTAASVAEHVLGAGQSVGLLSNGGDAAERYPSDWSGETLRRRAEAVSRVAARRVQRLRPVAIAAGRGAWQRDRLRTALARLVPSEGLSLPALLVSELPRLPRSLVLGIITPTLDEALASALGACRRAGLEIAVIWLRREGDRRAAGALAGVPVHPVSSRQDLALLGGIRL